ncbi:hypothetical protein [Alistipes finegoldii]|uniref:hypothetical protein n=1 Tax=Alistipes finegoldii TaxID=214856 RepID=UPI0024326A47|nr:hypothetical protein [Alistipes finegoldii]
MYKLKTYLLGLVAVLAVACSEKETTPSPEPEVVTPVIPDVAYTAFTDQGAVVVPVDNPEAFKPVAVRIKGDTLFVANDHAEDRAVYISSLSTGQRLGKLNQWVRAGTEESFAKQIGDMEVTDRYIFVGQHDPSRFYAFDRSNLKCVNAVGCKSGYGSGITQLTHCYGLRAVGDRLFVRDLNSLRGYWIPEILVEVPFNVPIMGRVTGSVSFEYFCNSLALYKDRMWLTDRASGTVQSFLPGDMQPLFGELSNLEMDEQWVLSDSRKPLGIAVAGGEMLISVQGSNRILRFDAYTGEELGYVLELSDCRPGRLELCGESLYYITQDWMQLRMARGVENPDRNSAL